MKIIPPLYTKENIALIDMLLNDSEFRRVVEDDLGKVLRVQVDWEKNEVRFYGTRSAKMLSLPELINDLKSKNITLWG